MKPEENLKQLIITTSDMPGGATYELGPDGPFLSTWQSRHFFKRWPARPDAADVMEIETILDIEGLDE